MTDNPLEERFLTWFSACYRAAAMRMPVDQRAQIEAAFFAGSAATLNVSRSNIISGVEAHLGRNTMRILHADGLRASPGMNPTGQGEEKQGGAQRQQQVEQASGLQVDEKPPVAHTPAQVVPDGFAVVHETAGYFVGAWRDRSVAEDVVARSPSARGEIVRPFKFID